MLSFPEKVLLMDDDDDLRENIAPYLEEDHIPVDRLLMVLKH
jgi:DNA-binding response OmpR family regulator